MRKMWLTYSTVKDFKIPLMAPKTFGILGWIFSQSLTFPFLLLFTFDPYEENEIYISVSF